MKMTTKLSWLPLLSGFVFFYACTKNKNETMPDAQPERSQNEIAAKVVSWLQAQKPGNENGRNLTVTTLTEHLKLDELRVEPYRNGESLVVVPIKSSLVLKNNRKNNPFNHLVLVLDANEEISKGSIVQYTNGGDASSPLPANTFSNLFTQKFASLNGTFSVLKIFDSYAYGLTFENGKLTRLREPSKKENTNNLREGDECIDWYMVTTYSYPDGTTSTTEEYIGRSCPDGEGCYNTELESICPGQGGGGGHVIQYEYASVATKQWEPFISPDGHNKLFSIEKLYGTRRTNGGSTFSHFEHGPVNLWNNVEPSTPRFATWHHDEWSYFLTQDQKDGTVTLKGNISYTNAPSIPINKNQSWSASVLP